MENNVSYTFSEPNSRDLEIALDGTDITFEQILNGYGVVLITIFKYRNYPILEVRTPTYPILIKGRGRPELSIVKTLLLELINTPRDRIPLIMNQDRFTPFFPIIKNILENGEIKHEGSEPLAFISLLY